jgi:hypothetical protein
MKVAIRLIDAVTCKGEERLLTSKRLPRRNPQAATIPIEPGDGDGAFALHGSAHETALR